ncbi:glycosyltransferase family 2 protein [Serratia sp. D1N4]
MRFIVVVPTYNGGEVWDSSARSIKDASKNMSACSGVYIIDSESTDNTCMIARQYGINIKIISKNEFNHGGTRNLALEFCKDEDVIVFLTQDAIVDDEISIQKLISTFEMEKDIVAAYGCQLPHYDANPIASHARAFNYKQESYVSGIFSKQDMGIKTVFMSNSFSAYRASKFKELGGFPSNTILCEDMYFTAKAVLAGYKVAYVADAKVRHSHNYSAIEEFKRYFDIGVFHHDESWIRNSFGSAGGEGKKFILSEFKYLIKNAPLWIPMACLNNASKIIGYKLGQNYRKIPLKWRKKFSMHKRYWDNVSD